MKLGSIPSGSRDQNVITFPINAFPRTKKCRCPLSPADKGWNGHCYKSGQDQGEPVTAETLALSTAKGPNSTLTGHLSSFL